MLNQTKDEDATEVRYVTNYLDCMENLPNDLQRQLSRMLELDAACQKYVREFDQQQTILQRGAFDRYTTRKDTLEKIQIALIQMQDIGDEKLQIMQTIQDLIETKARELDIDYKNLRPKLDHESTESAQVSNSNSVSSSINNNNNNNNHQHSNNNNNTHHNNHHNNHNNHHNNHNNHTSSSSKVANVSSNTANHNNVANTTTTSSSGAGGAGGGGGADKFARRGRRAKTDTPVEVQPPAQPTPASSQETDAPSENQSPNLPSGSNGHKRASARKKRDLPSASSSSAADNNQSQSQQRGSQEDNAPTSPENDPNADPDEPTYCVCNRISFGKMIMCDNDSCALEWFHFQCVSITTKPKGKWYCPDCRGNKPNIMKTKRRIR